MSEKDKEICESLAEAMPGLSEFDKGYILGLTESAAKKAEAEQKAQEQSKTE